MADERKTIVIVDDEADARAFVQTIVEETGDFRILTAADGDAAIKMIQEEVPDLVVLDVMMPEREGFAVFAEMRKDSKAANVPVIMLTGVSEQTGVAFTEEAIGAYVGARPAAFLSKPVSPGELQKVIKQQLGL